MKLSRMRDLSSMYIRSLNVIAINRVIKTIRRSRDGRQPSNFQISFPNTRCILSFPLGSILSLV